MDTEDLIRRIVMLPRQFKEVQNKSIVTLLKESGYYEHFDEVDENNIACLLEKSPEIVEDWLIWSDDKRASSGWYFVETDHHYTVAYWPKNKFKEIKFSNKIMACASFIKREIESIRL